MWTRFMDMHSGGEQKEQWSKIYIEAPKEEAKLIFFNRFEHNPERVTCTCCGDDYSIDTHETLEEASAYDRGCDYGYFRPDGTECKEDEAWISGKGLTKGYSEGYVERGGGKLQFHKYQTLKQYKKSKDVLFIYADEIKSEERKGEIPKQGYVWVD
jgi:hypothetical protein